MEVLLVNVKGGEGAAAAAKLEQVRALLANVFDRFRDPARPPDALIHIASADDAPAAKKKS